MHDLLGQLHASPEPVSYIFSLSISSLHSLYLSERQASYGFIACLISLHGVTISTYINGIELFNYVI